ncbi:MAG TPA: hypothetical protein VHZ78_10950 [Rhizomicrobium sp.]|jgi:hypothetical protein|nr:hypothetical protein [Rhizomicrobium sp.]
MAIDEQSIKPAKMRPERKAFYYVTAALWLFFATYAFYAPSLKGTVFIKALGGIALAFTIVPLEGAFRPGALSKPNHTRMWLTAAILLAFGFVLLWLGQKFAVSAIFAGVGFVIVALLLRTRVLGT